MMDKIEMSLDDIIKNTRVNQRKTGRGAGGIRRGGGGPQRAAAGRRASGGAAGSPRKNFARGRGAGIIQKSKFTVRGDVNSAWKHDMFDGPRRGILKSGIGGETAKLLVSNLDYGVSDSDINELFREFGPLKKAAVHYDRSGRSLGTADVLFERHADAVKALKQYNGVPLDGRPMNIQLATSDVGALTRVGRINAGANGAARGNQRAAAAGRQPLKRNSGGAPSARGRGTFNRNRVAAGAGGGVGGRRNKPAPTAEELDAELDAYVNDMKI